MVKQENKRIKYCHQLNSEPFISRVRALSKHAFLHKEHFWWDPFMAVNQSLSWEICPSLRDLAQLWWTNSPFSAFILDTEHCLWYAEVFYLNTKLFPLNQAHFIWILSYLLSTRPILYEYLAISSQPGPFYLNTKLFSLI